jgi:hypothetical protein
MNGNDVYSDQMWLCFSSNMIFIELNSLLQRCAGWIWRKPTLRPHSNTLLVK